MRSPSPRQAALADQIIVDSRKPPEKRRLKKDLLVSVGYSQSIAETKPTDVMEAKGVQIALERRGFTEDGAKQVVEEILYNKKVAPKTRLTAADMVFKTFGTYAAEKKLTVHATMDEILKEQLGKRKNEITEQNLDT